jgi:hypothetical protein
VVDQADNYQFLYPFGWQEVSVATADVVYKDVVEPLESVSVTITDTDKGDITEFGEISEVRRAALLRCARWPAARCLAAGLGGLGSGRAQRGQAAATAPAQQLALRTVRARLQCSGPWRCQPGPGPLQYAGGRRAMVVCPAEAPALWLLPPLPVQVCETLAKLVLTPPNQEVKVLSTSQVGAAGGRAGQRLGPQH